VNASIETTTLEPTVMPEPTVNPNPATKNVTPGITPDLAAIEQAIATLFPYQEVIELRVPKSATGNLVGFFTDPAKLAEAVAAHSGKAPAVYYTLNAPPLSLATNLNKVTRGSATKDEDIVTRNWLLIDCDPIRVDAKGKRLADQKVSSTDAEKASSMEVAKKVLSYLNELGWPSPITADSGNGYHLLYNLGGIPSTPELTKAVEDVLKALAKKFNSKLVGIDTVVSNPARVTKAYGSLAAKGIATADRPHRLSALRNAKGGKVPLTLSQLQKVGATVSVPSTTSNSSKATVTSGKKKIIINAQPQYGYASDTSESVTPEKMEEFLAFHKIDHKPKVRDEKNLRWKWQLIPCPFDESHKLGESAVFLYDTGRKGWKCFHNGCSERGEGESGWAKLLTHLFVTTGGKFAWYTNSPQALPANASATHTFGFDWSDTVEAESLDWLWPNRIPFGKLTLFAGHPGVGKGMATIYVIAKATTGKDWHDAKNTNAPMKAMLISSEDAAGDTLIPRLMAAGAARDKVGIHRIMTNEKGEKAFSLDVDLPALRKVLEDNKDIKIVVIDPISNHLGSLAMNKEQELRAALTPLAALAEKLHVAIIIVAHFNKSDSQSAIQRVGGAMGMVGAVRIAWSFGTHDGVGKMTLLKGNVVANKGGLEYAIISKNIPIKDQPTPIGRIEWGDVTQDDSQTVLSSGFDKGPNKMQQAMAFLIDHLQGGIIRPAAEVMAQAKTMGFKPSTLKNAGSQLNIIKTFTGGKDGAWLWQLPEQHEDTNAENDGGNND
jgi:hypothetical protein